MIVSSQFSRGTSWQLVLGTFRHWVLGTWRHSCLGMLEHCSFGTWNIRQTFNILRHLIMPYLTADLSWDVSTGLPRCDLHENDINLSDNNHHHHSLHLTFLGQNLRAVLSGDVSRKYLIQYLVLTHHNVEMREELIKLSSDPVWTSQ